MTNSDLLLPFDNWNYSPNGPIDHLGFYAAHGSGGSLGARCREQNSSGLVLGWAEWLPC